MTSFKAGFGRADITPKLGCQMVGYGNRKSGATGVHDPLLARALVVEDEGGAWALVSNDLCYTNINTVNAIRAAVTARTGIPVPARKRRHHPIVASLPMRWRFYRSGLYISPLAPLLLGVATGIVTMLMGIGGGFVLVPIMLYILGMSANVVVGTSLFQILFVTMVTTMMHALTTKAVDIVLAVMLLIGSVSGAQVGAQFAQKAKPEHLRLVLAILVLLVALRMALGLGYRPDEIYTVSPL